MNILLDTSTLIWALGNSSRLSDSARDIIDDPASAKHVSVASLWEISIKCSSGKLKTVGFEMNSLIGMLYSFGIDIIVIDPFEAMDVHRLPAKENHRDPFDRMLICQAIGRNLTLLSGDEKFAQYREHGLSLIW